MNLPILRHEGYNPLGACGKGKCPICARNLALLNIRKSIPAKEFSSDSYSVFVGHYDYPNVNVGILEPPAQSEDSWLYDSPNYWARNNFEIPRIVELRSSLINSRFRSHVLDARKNHKLLELGQEISMASEPVAIEVSLEKKPQFRLSTDSHALPMGPSAGLKKVQLTENPKIPRKIDKVVSDTDMKATDAIAMLYESHFDDNTLSKLLSIGNLGLGKDRKLVPTRYSITAVDSSIGNRLAREVKQYQPAGHLAFFGGYLGNYFLILFFSEVYSFELFETYVPRFNRSKQFTTDFESYGGRKKYAEETAGGFYASRLGVLEKLREIRKQASVLVLRFITDEYTIPLGVFVVRESVRKALSTKPIEFDSKELMLKYANMLLRKKFSLDSNDITKHSRIIRSTGSQTKLGKFV